MDTGLLDYETQLLLLEDTFSQPGVLLFRHLFCRSLNRKDKKTYPVLICFQTHPERLLEDCKAFSADHEDCTIIDCYTPQSLFCVPSSSTSRAIPLHPNELKEYLSNITASSSKPLTLFIDSVNSFADATSPTFVYKLMRSVFEDPDTSAVILYHNDLPTLNDLNLDSRLTSNSNASLEYILTTLTPSMLHIRIYHPKILEHLARSYHLRVDPDGERGNHDPRIYDYLVKFERRSWGTPFSRSQMDEETEEDEEIAVDGLGDSKIGKCLIQWELRGRPRNIRLKPNGISSRGNFSWGMQGLLLTRSDTDREELTTTNDLQQVAKFKYLWSSKEDEQKAKEDKAKEEQNPIEKLSKDVTFNLTMSDKQREARSEAANTSSSGGQIFYTPTEVDDVDEEDPDDDLEI